MMSDVFNKLFDVEPRAWIALGLIMFLSILGLMSLSRKKEQASTIAHTKKIVYGGICISISFVLSYIRIFHLPQGGSITLASMFPLVLYSMIFGPIAGIVAGFAYGMLQLIQDLVVVNMAQLFLDYPLAFGCIGLAGIMPKFLKNIHLRTFLAVTLALLGRGTMHIISGWLFFGEYAPEGMSTFVYSLGYNGTIIIGELIITLILAMILVSTPIYSTLKKGASPSFSA